MKTSEFDYDLPQDRIAKFPIEPRDHSKLLLCQSEGSLGNFTKPFTFSHLRFYQIIDHLNTNDILIVNDAKVLPVRLLGFYQNGLSQVEVLILKKISPNEVIAILKMNPRARVGLQFYFEPGLTAELLTSHEERLENHGEVRLRFSGQEFEKLGLEKWLESYGHVPLPPYIDRKDSDQDKKVYQTVYAQKSGSAAAPTAGFHFTEELLTKIKKKGIEVIPVTLHVGIGTFRPIKTENIEEHKMHEEEYEINEETKQKLIEAKKSGKRFVAVGTTVVRTLESWWQHQKSGRHSTSIYITPGFKFSVVDDLITNFHLPKSTLIVMIAAAMSSKTECMRAYEQALKNDYRFFSYGDAMFIRGASLKK